MKVNGFPSRYKIVKTDEFSSVFTFRRRVYGQFFVLHFKPNHLGRPRLGLVVSKKIAKRAVARNYMKRIVREWFRCYRSKLDAVDIIFGVKKSFSHPQYFQVCEELLNITSRMHKEFGRIKKEI